MHPFEWLSAPASQALFSCFRKRAEIRFVGGCVRNSLLGLPFNDDFDLAITCPPERTLQYLREAGITAVPTGIKHGTVSAIIEGVSYEITTLRKDKEHDGRHATVEFTEDWEGDALRRDFTINALYVDEYGKIFDFTGGHKDIKQGLVRFIGCPDDRIQEDYLRILRFFRIHAYYGKSPLDKEALISCVRHKHMLGSLSKERITKEFFKLLDARNPWYVVDFMVQTGIMMYILQAPIGMKPCVLLEHVTGYCPGAYVRWASIAPNPCAGLCLSRKQKAVFNALHTPLESQDILHSLYQQEPELVLGRWWMSCMESLTQTLDRAIHDWNRYSEYIRSFVEKPFPIHGKMLLDRGLQGQEIGEALAQTKHWWIEQGTAPDATACLAYALSVQHTLH